MESHPTRSAILEHVKNEPGVHFTELMDRFSLSEGTIRYHLHVLLKGKLIVSKLNKGRRRYYPSGFKGQKIQWFTKMDDIQLNSEQKKIIAVIEKGRSINQKDLSRLTGMSRFRLRLMIHKLMDLGFVRIDKAGKEVRYRRTSREEIRKEVLRSLVTDLLSNRIDEETYLKARKILDHELF